LWKIYRKGKGRKKKKRSCHIRSHMLYSPMNFITRLHEHMNKLNGLFTTELYQTFYTMITGKHSGSTIAATVIGICISSSGVVQSSSSVSNSALSSIICKIGKQGCTCNSQHTSPGPLARELASQPEVVGFCGNAGSDVG